MPTLQLLNPNNGTWSWMQQTAIDAWAVLKTFI